MKSRIWPGNECDCQDEENLEVHDYLCDVLEKEMAYSEDDICTASVGMWGAIKLMRDKLDVERTRSAMLEVRIKDLKEQYKNLEKITRYLEQKEKEE